jgi:hypothetical protein
MLRRSLIAALVVVLLASSVQNANAAGRPSCPRLARIMDYLFGGYGYGPFGRGYVSYAGHPPIYNHTTCGHPIK